MGQEKDIMGRMEMKAQWIIIITTALTLLAIQTNITSQSNTNIQIQPLINQTINITNGTLILPHLEKWIFNDNGSYIYFGGSGVYVPFPPAGEYIQVDITDGVANYSLPLDLSDVMPDGYGVVNVTYNGEQIGYWVEKAWSKVWVKLPANGNYTLRINIEANANNTGSPDQAFLFYDDFNGNSLNTSKWTPNYVNSVDYEVVNGYLHIAGASASGSSYWIYDNTDTGSQIKANFDISSYDNVEIVWYQSMDDETSTNQMGQVGIALIKSDKTIEAYGESYDALGGSYQSVVNAIIGSSEGEEKDITTGRIYRFVLIKNGYNYMINIYDDNNVTIYSYSSQSSAVISYMAIAVGAYGGYPFEPMKIYNVTVKLPDNSNIEYNTRLIRSFANVTYPYELSYYRLNDTSNQTIFLADPLFYNCSNYFDVINWDTGAAYGNVSRVADNSTWFWVFNGYYNDSMVHLLFFPLNTLVVFSYSNGSIARMVLVNDTDPIKLDGLDGGVYNVVLYGYAYYSSGTGGNTSTTTVTTTVTEQNGTRNLSRLIEFYGSSLDRQARTNTMILASIIILLIGVALLTYEKK